jgi:ATP-dependent Clp endopeptidase proteolytic subunit ClpP
MKLTYRNQRNAEIIARFWNKPLDKPGWFEIKSQSEDEAEILIYDVIGWPFIEAGSFIDSLNNFGTKTVKVRINSPGGDVFDALAIYNAMDSYKGKIITFIDSLAASAASVVAVAGHEVQAYKNAMMMIHEPWSFAIGNQYELTDIAGLLGKISGNLVDIYADKSNIGKRDIKSMMKSETWFTAKEMKEKGLIDTIIDGSGAKAKFDLSIYSKAPECIDGQKEGRELTSREIETALRDAGASRNFAKAVAAGRSEELKRKDIDDTNQRDAEIAQNLKTIISNMTGGYSNA